MAQLSFRTSGGKTITLNTQNEIHSGGEGKIFLLNKFKVAKIYHSGIKPIDKTHFDELQKLDKKLFIIPDELLYKDNRIAGYTMNFAGNDFFALASCFNKNFVKKNNCNQNIKQKIARQLVEAVKIAHRNNIVIGDLSQYNVLVNLKGEIRLIDTDSYKIPGYSHSGLLFDEIRDYLYNGIVSKSSDYFALSVLLFYLFTYTHPFKGIHRKYKKLPERMIHKIPVFVNDPLLKVPKCYQALQDKKLLDAFKRLYIGGERFLLDVSTINISTSAIKPPAVQHFDEKELSIKLIEGKTNIINVYFDYAGGYIETGDRFIIYSARYKGQINRRFDLLKTEFDQVFVYGDTVLARKNDTLYHCSENKNPVGLQNFKYKQGMHAHQFGNILLMIGNNQMYQLYLDDLLNTSIKNKRIEVFGEGFKHHAGLIQNTGGTQRIFYNTGKNMASVKTERNLKAVYQQANTGIMQYIEKGQLYNRYFKIKGLKFLPANHTSVAFTHFAYMPGDKDEGFIFEPADTGISIIRTEDFKVISKMNTGLISSESVLFYTKSGIVAWEDESVYLMNRKESK